MTAARTSRRLWASWALMALVLTVALTVGASGGGAPANNQERVYEIASTLSCPQCAGQSVAESDAEIAQEIRAEIATMVSGGRGDDAIRDRIAAGYEQDIRLEPSRSGVTGLVWIVPVVVVVGAVAGLALAFRRWSRRRVRASEADRELVEEALRRRGDRP